MDIYCIGVIHTSFLAVVLPTAFTIIFFFLHALGRDSAAAVAIYFLPRSTIFIIRALYE